MKKVIFILMGLIISCSCFAQDMKIAGRVDYGTDRYIPFYAFSTNSVVTNTLSEVTVFSTTIPAGSIGSNGILRINYQYTANTTNASNKQCVLRFGNTVVKRNVMNANTENSLPMQINIYNRNSPSSQIGLNAGTAPSTSYTASGQTLSTFAVNTDVDQIFSIGLSNQTITDSTKVDYLHITILKNP